jgi:deazaflavin-dependent oxidoreductase (nitroreductase family)
LACFYLCVEREGRKSTPAPNLAATLRAFRAVSGEVFDNPTGWVARNIRRYVESGGTRGHTFNGNDALLLTTRGRRTGRLRRTALYYGRDGERYVLVATAVRGGGDPSWYLNLLDNPAVVVQVRSEIFGAIATPASACEWPRLWALMVDAVPKYRVYEKRAGRDLAGVVVERC